MPSTNLWWRAIAATLAVGALSTATMSAPAQAFGPTALHGEPDGPKLGFHIQYGGTVGATPTVFHAEVVNNGTAPIDGFSMFVGNLDSPQRIDGSFRNCAADANSVTCLFPVTLEPGVRHEINLPIRAEDRWPGWVRGDLDAVIESWGDETTQQWRKVAEHADPMLVPTPAAAAMPAGAFENRGTAKELATDYKFTYSVVPEAKPDLAAVAADVTGHRGDTVRPRVGIRNEGPAVIQFPPGRSLGGHPDRRAEVFTIAVPDGVTVTKLATADCLRLPDGSEPAGGSFAELKKFTCYGIPWVDQPSRPGDLDLPELELRLDRDLHDAVGTVTVVMNGDTVATNNTARFVINPSAPAPATTGPTAAAPGATNGAAGGQGAAGGGLPITGPASGALIVAGAATLLTGALLLVLTSRRRRPGLPHGRH
ncbi:hypothetical protein [Krasilnikovia sp. M28-CT-15]|uniref:hypothetical protein n=1 Tax=Krasilnikovia sp. M28-CT-15 TaxID=3373540 RepID=UPI003876E5C8